MFRAVISSLLLCIIIPASSQDTLSYADQLKAIELEMDSLSIFNLIDSLFAMEVGPKSELNVRFGYSSSVTSAGRDYGLDQAGLSSGLAYYHKKGWYSDLSGYWNDGLYPKYNPTILSLGYLGISTSKWSYSFDFERWFYNQKDTSENPLVNSFGTSASYNFAKGFASIDYSFLFGKEIAHRIIGNLSWDIKLGKWWIFQSINLYPSANILFGNSDLTELRVTNNINIDRVRSFLTTLNSFNTLNTSQRVYLHSLISGANDQGFISDGEQFQLRRKIRNSEDLSTTDKEILFKVVNAINQPSEFMETNKFGLLNYSFMLPLSLSTGKFNILLSYTYSIPVKLPGEFFSVEPVGYFGASISYRIPFD